MDGAHLKGKFKGSILHAVAMDGNNQIMPIGYGICKGESLRSWTWFLRKLHECIGDCEGSTFVTDRAVSIDVSLQNVFPRAHHGFCGWHLLQNISSNFGRNDKTAALYWRLVRAYTTSDFEALWDRFSRVRPSPAEFLSAIPREKWTRAYSLGVRYDFMTSNSAESMNSLSRFARKHPILPLLEFFRATMQKWFYERRKTGAQLTTELTPWAEIEVQAMKVGTRGWTVSGIMDTVYQVHDFRSGGIVDLRDKTCSCRVWQLTGLPCGHVLMVLTYLKQPDYSHMASDFYKVATYRRTYQEAVYPLPERRDWEVPHDLMIVRPPEMNRAQPGRPRNTNRIPSQGEEPRIRECSRCGRRGHTIRTCVEFLPKEFAPKKKKNSRNGNGASGSGTQGASGSGTQGTQGTGRVDYVGTVDLNS